LFQIRHNYILLKPLFPQPRQKINQSLWLQPSELHFGIHDQPLLVQFKSEVGEVVQNAADFLLPVPSAAPIVQ
jgi:hypothetical protein